jgi:eukaryotic-like serine/threonine-protein kinase
LEPKKTCARCGAPLSGAATAANCARCLLELGLGLAGDDDSTVANAPPPGGETIGPYRLLEKLGEGGMGVVWLAAQRSPVRRMVALKLIRPGLDSKQVLARFESERQALAVLDHAGIAKVFDAGTTADGRPFFAMERVVGEPITRFCDRNRLSVPDRLALFVQLCEAVQHAHQKGIVHRDLKPSNVLVAVQDDRPVVKIIDFGVAKALGAKLTELTLETRAGVFIGTPEYMSPEQAGTTAAAVDTRTDIYALGVMLYELLVGVRPFELRDLKDADLIEMMRHIRESEPPRLTTRLNSLGDGAAEVARCRHVDPRSLARLVRGDLQWIAMKALDKAPARRYASASEFAADIERHLAYEPVAAGPPSLVYQSRKFVRRHRLGVAAAVVTIAAVLAGAALATIGLVRARRAEAAAKQDAATAREISAFLVGIFEQANPTEARGHDMTVKDAVAQAEMKLKSELRNQGPIRGRMLHALGNVRSGIGDFPGSVQLFDEALAADRDVAEPDASEVAETLTDRAFSQFFQGHIDEARSDAMVTLKTLGSGPAPSSAAGARAQYIVAVAAMASGRFGEAERWYERTLPILEDQTGRNVILRAWCFNDLGILRRLQGDTKGLLEVTGRALEVKTRVLGADHPDTLQGACNYAYACMLGGEVERGLAVIQKTLVEQERILGGQHPLVANSLHTQAEGLRRAGRYDEARAALMRAKRILGSTGQPYLIAQVDSGLLRVALAEGNLEEALQHLAAARSVQDTPDLANDRAADLEGIAAALTTAGRFSEAEPLLREAAELRAGIEAAFRLDGER